MDPVTERFGDLDHDLRYDALVCAASAAEATSIAAEALPAGCHIVYVEACDVAHREGPRSFQVSIWFAGRFGRAAG